MPGSAFETIDRFGRMEDDQRYTRLVDLFADDAIYYDPFFGAQRGRAQIRTFMERMEEVVPASGARFDSWQTEADTNCGWAQWIMVARDGNGDEVPVPGQSLYRLRDGLVTFVADHVDCLAYRRLRGPDATAPNHAAALGMSAHEDQPGGSARRVIEDFWRIQGDGRYRDLADLFADDAEFIDQLDGAFRGSSAIAGFFDRMQAEMPAIGARFELVDLAGDESVGWSQWWCRLPGGDVPGWTLHRFRGGRISLDSDHFDSNAARAARSSGRSQES